MAADQVRLAFAGAGRLAAVLAPALEQAGYSVAAVASRSAAHGEQLAQRLAGCRVVPLDGLAEQADVIFLTVPDSAIGAVSAEVRWRAGSAAVHCSGAAGLDVLQAAASAGAAVGSFHPLQSFAAGAEAPLAGVTVAIEGLEDVLASMARALGCRPLSLPPGLKPLYHASATLASNYLVTLLGQAARLWQPLGCSESEALAALLPLVRTTVDNVERLGAAGALTGPIARGDGDTVRRHLAALGVHAPDLLPMYRELGLETLPLAQLAPEPAAELTAILSKETIPCV